MTQQDNQFELNQGSRLQDLDLRKVIVTIQRGRWVILATLILFIIPAYLYVRYTPSRYETVGMLKIDVGADKAIGGFGNENFLSGEIENQAELLKSRNTILKAVEKLHLNIQYFKKGRVIKSSLYSGFCPFEVIPDSVHFKAFNTLFEVQFSEGDRFVIYPQGRSELKQTCKLGQICIIDNNVLRIRQRPQANGTKPSGDYQFVIAPLDATVSEINRELKVELYRGTIYKISYVDEVGERARDIVNAISSIYLADELSVLQKSSDQTIMFIDTLLMAVSAEMGRFERNLEGFERRYQIPINEVKRNYRQDSYLKLEEENRQAELTLLALRKLEDYILAIPERQNQGQDIAVLPQLPDILSDEINAQSQKLNALQLRRSLLLEKYQPNNPIILRLDEEVKASRQILFSIITENRQLLEERRKAVQERQSRLTGQISQYVTLERDLENVRKPYSLYENIYNGLFNKKTEASIARAAITSRSRVVNPALVPSEPISPKRSLILYGALALGLIVGFAVVLVKETFKDTIELRFDAEGRTTIPLIAEIFRMRRKIGEEDVNVRLEVFKNTKSILTESFRSLRSNVTFLVNGIDKQTISITSTISGEGKSFIALNLAAILSTLNKKVVLVDLDLRRPRIHLTMNMNNEVGASSFLVRLEPMDKIIQPSGYQNLDIITSGPVPPNPAELLTGPTFAEFVEELKRRYDFIVFDTSPVGLVTDALRIMNASDLNLYVFRAEYSKVNFFKMAERLMESQKLNNIYIVFNASNPSLSKYGYSYGYGYGYSYGYTTGYYTYTEEDAPRKKWWHFWKD